MLYLNNADIVFGYALVGMLLSGFILFIAILLFIFFLKLHANGVLFYMSVKIFTRHRLLRSKKNYSKVHNQCSIFSSLEFFNKE